MSVGPKIALALAVTLISSTAPAFVTIAEAGAREEGRLLMATEVLQEVQGMPDQRLPENLLRHAYGIAVIPDLTNIAFIFGGRHGNGVMVVRDKLNSPWSNPVCIAITGGSWGLQIGAQSSDVILVFTTRQGVEGVAGGKLTLGADASVAAGPYGRQGSAATDFSLAEIYSYARSRGLFGGIALDGNVISIDRSANASLYQKKGVTASEVFSGQAPAPPESAQRFLAQVTESTRTPVMGSPVAAAAVPTAPASVPVEPASDAAAPAAAQVPVTPSPAAEAPRTYPLEEPK